MKLSIKNRIIAAGLTIVLGVGGAVLVYAASTPGSESDPVVTKSYVDQAIATALANSGSAGGTTTGGYEVVHLNAGQTLKGGEGTEIILRSGEGTAIDNGSNGISDITSGTELWTGNKLQTNHLILVPRADGRGVHVTTEAYLMVRGVYSIQG